MIYAPATRYIHFTANDTGFGIEIGTPILVHGIVFSTSSGQNADLLVYDPKILASLPPPTGAADALPATILRLYADMNFGNNPTRSICGPFLAQNGLIVYGWQVLLDWIIAANVDATVFYSHVGY